ncbi:unnamed protein product [Vicia faba]|uniref:Uncharacterized protein n=1 Tax=Vicia faba TaxID=3906 RepID=A0AAV1A473_VICFA|nr:unnamed protein product [Vicia faba]
MDDDHHWSAQAWHVDMYLELSYPNVVIFLSILSSCRHGGAKFSLVQWFAGFPSSMKNNDLFANLATRFQLVEEEILQRQVHLVIYNSKELQRLIHLTMENLIPSLRKICKLSDMSLKLITTSWKNKELLSYSFTITEVSFGY